MQANHKNVFAIFITFAVAVASPHCLMGQSPLADSVERGERLSRVLTLLGELGRPNAAQVDGMTALHWAAFYDRAELAAPLLEAKAEPDVVNRYGVTPLSLACTNGNGEFVKQLLHHGADPNLAVAGETPLLTASRTGRLQPVRLLLENGAKVNATVGNGQTALMWAAAEGHAKVVSLLLEKGADPELTLRSGFNPFFFAVREGHADVVQVLLAAGADVHRVMRPNAKGTRAPRNGTSALLLAVENGHFQLAIDLIEAGADPNDARSGVTPLHALTWVRKPNRGDGIDGDPPPRGSGRLSSLQFARQLVAKGARVNAQIATGRAGPGRLNMKGATAFLLACKTADAPLMRLLRELGADPAIANADGVTAMMAAAGVGTFAPGEMAGTEDEALESANLLLDWGLDINAVDRNGETAMHGAAYKNFPRMVRLLAKHGAKIEVWNRKNKYGWTPVLIAEGHRPGNFRPSAETLAAIHAEMRSMGVEPPALTPPPAPRKRGYEKP